MGNSTSYIYSDRVWANGKFIAGTICINNGIISDLFNYKHDLAEDHSGHVIMPGVIDAHVHINEPGRTEWEGFDTATQAAAVGGTTLLVDMPLNSSPVVTNLDAFENKLKATHDKLHVNCAFWAGAIGQDTNQVLDLINAGCLGVKVFISDSGIDEFPNISIDDLDQLMASLGNKDIPVLAHCELDTLPASDSIQANPQRYSAYLASRPPTWEHEAIKLFIGLSERHNCRAHIVHLATSDIIPWITAQKEKGVPFTVETCPHYLFFRAEHIEDGNTLLKCAPPIREGRTTDGLIEGLHSGVIDFITTDHSPAPASLKEIDSGDFAKAWGGISGMQFLLSASWTALKAKIRLEEFIPLLTEKPAKFLGLERRFGQIAKGFQADVCIWNPESDYLVTETMIKHKHKETPYLNQRLFGEVKATYIGGKKIMEDGKILTLNSGEIILRSKKMGE